MSIMRPTLCIVAGPNGSGKTTTTRSLLSHVWSEDSVYINPDDLAEEKFGGWNSPEAVKKAAECATEMRYACLESGANFVFETVFSSGEKLDFVKKAKDAGFFIRLFFVCTETPEINVRRVARRYLEGGHEVAISKVISRYYKSLVNLHCAAPIVDRLYVYDNSVEDEAPRLLFRISDGKLAKLYECEIPAWAEPLLRRSSL